MFKCQCGCGQQSKPNQKQEKKVVATRIKRYWTEDDKQTEGREIVAEINVIEDHN